MEELTNNNGKKKLELGIEDQYLLTLSREKLIELVLGVRNSNKQYTAEIERMNKEKFAHQREQMKILTRLMKSTVENISKNSGLIQFECDKDKKSADSKKTIVFVKETYRNIIAQSCNILRYGDFEQFTPDYEKYGKQLVDYAIKIGLCGVALDLVKLLRDERLVGKGLTAQETEKYLCGIAEAYGIRGYVNQNREEMFADKIETLAICIENNDFGYETFFDKPASEIQTILKDHFDFKELSYFDKSFKYRGRPVIKEALGEVAPKKVEPKNTKGNKGDNEDPIV